MSEPDWSDDDSWILDSLYGINRSHNGVNYTNDDLDEIVDADPDDGLGIDDDLPADDDDVDDSSFYDDDIEDEDEDE